MLSTVARWDRAVRSRGTVDMIDFLDNATGGENWMLSGDGNLKFGWFMILPGARLYIFGFELGGMKIRVMTTKAKSVDLSHQFLGACFRDFGILSAVGVGPSRSN